MKKKVDIDPQNSQHKGLVGLYESTFRKFKTIMYLLTLMPIYGLGAIILGLSLLPGITVFRYTQALVQEAPLILQNLTYGVAIATAYILYGLTLIFIVPIANFILRAKPKVFRGPYYSVDFLQWYMHNALTYIVRYTFLEFITPTPFNLLFLKLMGMKIGRGTQINTSNISDPSLINIGKNVTIGGSVTLCAHYGQDGYLIIAPLTIGDRVTVGLKASIFGGVTIASGAKILPHSVVLPKTIIGENEVWGGVPAVKI